MKTLRDYLAAAIALVVCILLGACAPAPESWRGKPDPRDMPPVEIAEPEANGHFGPFGTAPAGHRNFTGSP